MLYSDQNIIIDPMVSLSIKFLLSRIILSNETRTSIKITLPHDIALNLIFF